MRRLGIAQQMRVRYKLGRDHDRNAVSPWRRFWWRAVLAGIVATSGEKP